MGRVGKDIEIRQSCPSAAFNRFCRSFAFLKFAVVSSPFYFQSYRPSSWLVRQYSFSLWTRNVRTSSVPSLRCWPSVNNSMKSSALARCNRLIGYVHCSRCQYYLYEQLFLWLIVQTNKQSSINIIQTRRSENAAKNVKHYIFFKALIVALMRLIATAKKGIQH